MHEITITKQFSAAHAIRLYDGALEPVHGHDWTVRVTVAAEALDAIEVVMDFHVLEQTVAALIQPLHNHHLNEVAPFADGRGGLAMNPTAERVAWWLATQIAPSVPSPARLVSVQVTEAPGCAATYRP